MGLNKSVYILTLIIFVIIFNEHISDANCKYDYVNYNFFLRIT